MTKRAVDLAGEVPWVIYEPALQSILEIAARETPSPEALSAWKSKMEGPAAVAARQGDPLMPDFRTTIRDGVAIVPVSGPIFRYANLFTEFSGATSIEMLALEFKAALESPKVRAIILDIDSPGGQVSGTAEFAAMVRGAQAQKPVAAYVGAMAASGAYWIASAAGQIVMNRTAMLGSIGVVATINDTRERDSRSGVKTYEIVSSQSPDKRLDVATEGGRSKIQAMIDRLAVEFIDAVASQRGITVDTVLADFGQGGMKVGTDAVTARMADRIGSFEETLSELAAAGIAGSRRPLSAAAHVNSTGATMDKPTIDSIGRDHPEIAAHFREDGRATAATAAKTAQDLAVKTAVETERARIQAIDNLAAAYPGHVDLIAKAKADGTSVEQTALAVSGAEKVKKDAALQSMKTDIEGNEKVAPTTTTDGTKPAMGTDANAIARDISALVAEEAKQGRKISHAQAAGMLRKSKTSA